MATISENLQTIKDSTDAIKQAIIDKGGTIEGDITTWADAISGISGGGSGAGSVFKIITAAMALEENVTNLNNKYNCPGYIVVAGQHYNCHKHSGHGVQNLNQGKLQQACKP